MNFIQTTYAALFLDVYRRSDIRIQKKARILAPTVIVITALTLLLVAVMALTEALAVAGILSCLLLFCVIVLFFLSKAHYETASSIFRYGLLLVMFAAIKFDAYRDVYETYVFASLGLFFMILVSLVGARRFHALVATIGTIVGIFVIYYFDAYPKDGRTVTLLAIQNLSTCSIIVIAGGFLSGMTIHMQNTLVNETLTLATRARTQYEELMIAVSKANDAAYGIGSKLAEASETLSMSIQQFRISLSEETSGLQTLDETLATNAHRIWNTQYKR